MCNFSSIVKIVDIFINSLIYIYIYLGFDIFVFFFEPPFFVFFFLRKKNTCGGCLNKEPASTKIEHHRAVRHVT